MCQALCQEQGIQVWEIYPTPTLHILELHISELFRSRDGPKILLSCKTEKKKERKKKKKEGRRKFAPVIINKQWMQRWVSLSHIIPLCAQERGQHMSVTLQIARQLQEVTHLLWCQLSLAWTISHSTQAQAPIKAVHKAQLPCDPHGLTFIRHTVRFVGFVFFLSTVYCQFLS